MASSCAGATLKGHPLRKEPGAAPGEAKNFLSGHHNVAQSTADFRVAAKCTSRWGSVHQLQENLRLAMACEQSWGSIADKAADSYRSELLSLEAVSKGLEQWKRRETRRWR